MIIKALNLDILWKSPQENFNKIENLLRDEVADIFLLPEMFSTGFCMEASEIADVENKVLDWMKSFSQKKNTAVVGSVSVKEKGQYYNRMYFVQPSGRADWYDKRHLFSYSGEDKIYTKGKNKIIIDYQGVRFLLMVCYDLRFPVFSRNNADYDVILYVANWPESRIDAWETLLKARAIENQSFVFGVNRIGTDGNGLNYPESSFCFFADGSLISEKVDNVVSAQIDMERLLSFRKKYSFLDDRDNFELI